MYIICPTQPVKVSFPGGVILEGLKIFAFFRYYPDFSFLIYLQCKNTSAKLLSFRILFHCIWFIYLISGQTHGNQIRKHLQKKKQPWYIICETEKHNSTYQKLCIYSTGRKKINNYNFRVSKENRNSQVDTRNKGHRDWCFGLFVLLYVKTTGHAYS